MIWGLLCPNLRSAIIERIIILQERLDGAVQHRKDFDAKQKREKH